MCALDTEGIVKYIYMWHKELIICCVLSSRLSMSGCTVKMFINV